MKTWMWVMFLIIAIAAFGIGLINAQMISQNRAMRQQLAAAGLVPIEQMTLEDQVAHLTARLTSDEIALNEAFNVVAFRMNALATSIEALEGD